MHVALACGHRDTVEQVLDGRVSRWIGVCLSGGGSIFSTCGTCARKNAFLAAKALGDSPLYDALY